MKGSEEFLTGRRYLDMQVLEDEPECASNAKIAFEVLIHDAVLT
jgi:hypothetical protein